MSGKSKTLLDELVRTLNVRKNAWARYNRRLNAVRNYPSRAEWYDSGADLYAYAPNEVKSEIKQLRRNVDDAEGLLYNLGDKAEGQYRDFLRSHPGKKALQKAWYEMPDDIMEDYIEMFGSPTSFK